MPDRNRCPTGSPYHNRVHLGSAGHEPELERWDRFLRNEDGSRYGPQGDHTCGRSGHEYADAYKHTRHGSRNGMGLETIGPTMTMTGATSGNTSHACHHGRPVCRTRNCFGWSRRCLRPHGTGIVDTGDWWRMASRSSQSVTCRLFMSHRTRGCLS